MMLGLLAILAVLSVAESACVTTNSANTDCIALTDANFKTAVDAWIADPGAATVDYGAISDW